MQGLMRGSFKTSHSAEHTSVPPHSKPSGDDGGQHPPHPHFPTHYQPAHTLSPTHSWFSNLLYHLIILISLSYNMSMLPEYDHDCASELPDSTPELRQPDPK